MLILTMIPWRSPFYRWGNPGLEKLGDLPKVTQPGRKEWELKLKTDGFQNQYSQRPSPIAFPRTAGKPILGGGLQQRLQWAHTFATKNTARLKSGEFPVTGGIEAETRYPPTGGRGGSSSDLEQWYLKCSPQISGISIIWEPIKMKILRPHPDALNQKLWGRGTQQSVFYWALQVILMHVNVGEAEA